MSKPTNTAAPAAPPRPLVTPEPARKVQTAVYMPEALRARLARYMHANHEGKLNVRNSIIVAAIEEKLTKEGF